MALRQCSYFTGTFGASTTLDLTISSFGLELLDGTGKNAFVVFGANYSASDFGPLFMAPSFTGTNTLRFTRGTATGTPTVAGFLIEDSDLLCDHFTFGSFGDAEQTANLVNVTDIDKAICLSYGYRNSTASTSANTWTRRLFDDLGVLKVGVESGNYNSGAAFIDAVHASVIQHPKFSVQRGSLSDMTGTSITQAITSVDLTKSALICTMLNDSATTVNPDDIGVQWKFDSATQFQGSRTTGVTSLTKGYWECLTVAAPWTMRELLISMADTVGTVSPSISPALSSSGSKAFMFVPFPWGKSGYTGASDAYYIQVTKQSITDASNGSVVRGGTTETLDQTVYVLDMVPYVAPTAIIDTPPSGWTTEIEIGDSVYISGSVSDGELPFTHNWERRLDGGSWITFSTSADPGATAFNTAGTWEVRYTVTDNQANSDTSTTRTITVLVPEGSTKEIVNVSIDWGIHV